jgi:carbon-monoxide dehydrogenase medium subunit
MKPPRFSYAAPDTLDQALALLLEHGANATVLAGGQSLVPLLNLRVARPEVVIDLNRVGGLDAVEINGSVQLGALVRQQRALRDAGLRAGAPLVAAALGHVGHVASRSRGTLGGSIAHADPAAELPAVLLALDGSITVHSVRGERTIAAGDLFVAPFTTTLGPDELLTAISLPAPGPGDRYGFHEVARRHGDFALAGAACRLSVSGGRIEAAAIALFGVAGTPVRAPAAEAALAGAEVLDEGTAREAAILAAEGLEPPDDVHGSAAYRRRMAEVAVRRALRAADGDGG